MAGRFETLRKALTKEQRIIEIGPCHSPIAPKRDGWHAFSIDHTDRVGLLAKYAADKFVDPELIETVDYVWVGGPLSDAVPGELHGTFDVFIASHVIEHTPDLVAFLSSAERLLRREGLVVLAVPDKRVCFDFFRPVSTIGDVIEAQQEGRTRHTQKTLWEYSSYISLKQGHPGWSRTNRNPTELLMDFAHAAAFSESGKDTSYVDAHSWIFVPASFSLIVLELARLHLTDWEVTESEVADNTEFFVWLKRGGRATAAAMSEAEFSATRQRLLETILIELDDQSRQLSDSIATRMHAKIGALEASTTRAHDKATAARAQLEATLGLVASMRATHFWRARTRLRRLLGLPSTVADR
jgi:SAM-dependent methyltransferase